MFKNYQQNHCNSSTFSKLIRTGLSKLKKKKTLWPLFLWMGFNCLVATATSRGQLTFYHSVPRISWYSFYRHWKDERLSRPWRHPVVLNTVPLDWESSVLTTRPLLQNFTHCRYCWFLKCFCRNLATKNRKIFQLF